MYLPHLTPRRVLSCSVIRSNSISRRKGRHPDGTGVSALHHILDGEQTIPADKGLFLDETWRLHPAICALTSELFYAGKLRSRAGLGQQAIRSAGPIRGSGLRYVAVDHTGN